LADSFGSKDSRARLWKLELKRLVDDLGGRSAACHLLSGTSKRNRIECCLFAFIIGIGPTVHCTPNPSLYPASRVVSERVMVGVHLTRQNFLGEWK